MTSFHGRFHMGKGKLIAPGYAADLVVFDPETILDMSTNEDPNHYPRGSRTSSSMGRKA